MRKKLFLLNIVLILSLVLSACATTPPPTPAMQEPTQAAQPEPTKAPADTKPEPTKPADTPTEEEPTQEVEAPAGYSESPLLASQVSSGALPAVEERLPATPLVMEPIDEVGTYGGELRLGFTGDAMWGGGLFFMSWEHLVAWKHDFSGLTPNFAESWEISPDGREYTFTLRKGVKWSDGEPFTTDDIMFYIEDVIYDPDISKGGPSADWLPKDGVDEFKATKIDDYTFKLSFKDPNGLFLMNMATWAGRDFVAWPKHYLMKYHKKYNPDVDDLLAGEEGVQDWTSLFNKYGGHGSWLLYPERPTIYAWVLKQPLGAGTTILLERNPYYWKVDTAGNQLPYFDTLKGFVFQDNESRTTAMANGDVDFIKDPGEDNRALFYDALDAGKPLQIITAVGDGGVTNTIHFNRTIEDPVKSEIFASKDFRIGMSHAINRPRIIETIHNGQGTPSQGGPLEDSPLYTPEYSNQYTDYNVDLANEYLDKVLPDKDAQGFRLDKNGKRLSIIFSVISDLSWGQHWVRMAELLVEDWAAVGVEVKLNPFPDGQTDALKKQNQWEAFIFSGEGGAGLTAILDPRYVVPGEYWGVYGNGWFYSRINDLTATQVEMPEHYKALRAKYENVLKATTEEEQVRLMREVIMDAAGEFYQIGIARPGEGYQPFHSRLGNIKDFWVAGWLPGVFKIMLPEQWYLKQ
jgi:peptide/nickel transport system substrate-binding protein